MSLINDALKRARVSALEQEAERDGVDYRAVPAHSRRASRSLSHVAGWIVAAVAITGVLYLALRPAPGASTREAPPALGTAEVAEPVGPERQTAVLPETVVPETTAEAGIVADPETVAEPGAVATAESPSGRRSTPAAPEGSGSEPQPELEVVPAPEDAEPAADLGEATQATSPAPPPPPPEAPAARSGAANGLVDGRVYLRRAEAADGSVVELGGIAFSEDRPIAVVNGNVVSVGDMIEGFIVLRIEPERIWLEHGTTRIYLTLH